jgi:hypothetical protein
MTRSELERVTEIREALDDEHSEMPVANRLALAEELEYILEHSGASEAEEAAERGDWLYEQQKDRRMMDEWEAGRI